ncbi:MAG: hypothetical protein LBQ94_09390 [Treponema sp.]|jgi:hypothetical protein|nr:hypothetical protein [Treponema sp.]
MASSSSALNLLSGIAAAAAGLAGEKVAKDGTVPGLDLATIVPALLGSKTGATGSSSVLGNLASAAVKTAVSKATSGTSGSGSGAALTQLASLAGTLITTSAAKKATTTKAAATTTSKASTAVATIASLASAIVGNTGGSTLSTIATLASKLAGTAKTDKEKTSMASELGKTLSSAFGVSLNGTGSVITALGKALPSDTKSTLFTSILKGLIS